MRYSRDLEPATIAVLVLVVLAIVAALVAATVWVLQWAWNLAVAPTFDVQTISYLQAFALYWIVAFVGNFFRGVTK